MPKPKKKNTTPRLTPIVAEPSTLLAALIGDAEVVHDQGNANVRAGLQQLAAVRFNKAHTPNLRAALQMLLLDRAQPDHQALDMLREQLDKQIQERDSLSEQLRGALAELSQNKELVARLEAASKKLTDAAKKG